MDACYPSSKRLGQVLYKSLGWNSRDVKCSETEETAPDKCNSPPPPPTPFPNPPAPPRVVVVKSAPFQLISLLE